jgi:hypothetical protein
MSQTPLVDYDISGDESSDNQHNTISTDAQYNKKDSLKRKREIDQTDNLTVCRQVL